MADYTKYVDVFHGTGEIELPEPEGAAASWHAIKGLCGNTSPGAVLPFGKYSAAPYSGGYSSGYGVNRMNCGGPVGRLGDSMRLRGFSHFHNSGTGATNIYYNYAVVKPFYGEAEKDYGVENETGEPGYYSAVLAESGVLCELTVQKNCSMHRYTFDRPGGAVSVDFLNDGLYADEMRLRGKAEELCVKCVSEREIAASVKLQGIVLFFDVFFDGKGSLDGENVFRMSAPGAVTVCVSVSAESALAAKEELDGADRDFDRVRLEAKNAWNEALGKISAECEDENELRIFYSNLYHTFTKPCDWGKGGFLWKGSPFVVDIVTMWDIYKTQLPLVFSLFPEVSAHIVEMITRLGLERQRLPHSLMLSSDLNMETKQARALGEHSLYDAWKRGVRADWNAALDAVMADVGRPDFADYTERGECARTTHMLDMAEGCAAAAELARGIGRTAEAGRLESLSGGWRKAFNGETGLLWADREYYEGNHWNYSFRLLRNMDERIAMCGGRKGFLELLDRFFGFSHPEDVSARFEGFNNETDMETPYAYHFAGEYDRLCEVLDLGDRFAFRDSRGGAGPGAIPGNNDSGGLSSCYIWNCIGLFPVSGQDLMLAGRPKFSRLTMQLANGKTLVIEKHGSGAVPERVLFNGAELEKRRIGAAQMMGGGKIVFEMKKQEADG
ncbi:MAG: glycoside hydrolase family 92 protein [Clostridiales bacterium]|nr:glycoside hydrolase family 92 protein [Clostridiales bacterium]